MVLESDISRNLQQAVQASLADGTGLKIIGGNSKSFYGREACGRPLEVGKHRGILHYEPSELVITARSGTPLKEIEKVLAEQNQMLAFEPPHFGACATLGGAVACGFSGPRRPFAGALRDFVLGLKLLNGKAEIASFGGQVMKNVAGYDVSRLMAGALGTLGLLLEISLKVLPKPSQEITVRQSMTPARAIEAMNLGLGRPLPLSALCYDGTYLYARLAGSEKAVKAAWQKWGGELCPDGEAFWEDLREQRLPFFQNGVDLWRLSLAPAAPPLALPGQWLLDWAGAQRWLITDVPAERVFQAAAAVGGHATRFRAAERRGDVFQPLPGPLKTLHQNLKRAFDPAGLLNPGRLYKEW